MKNLRLRGCKLPSFPFGFKNFITMEPEIEVGKQYIFKNVDDHYIKNGSYKNDSVILILRIYNNRPRYKVISGVACGTIEGSEGDFSLTSLFHKWLEPYDNEISYNLF